uniref:Uncharacterized protein n=1 Tax=Anopheles coluzzii TaxID=1518534 RepID=A0A8W7Q2L7_ANOCL
MDNSPERVHEPVCHQKFRHSPPTNQPSLSQQCLARPIHRDWGASVAPNRIAQPENPALSAASPVSENVTQFVTCHAWPWPLRLNAAEGENDTVSDGRITNLRAPGSATAAVKPAYARSRAEKV